MSPIKAVTADAWTRIETEARGAFHGAGKFPVRAYSELMPPPYVGVKPYAPVRAAAAATTSVSGGSALDVDEYEQAHDVEPGLDRIAEVLVHELGKLVRGETHALSKTLLDGNPAWPAELASAAHAGKLAHDPLVIFCALALSRSQDDKGNYRWTLFGASHEGAQAPALHGLDEARLGDVLRYAAADADGAWRILADAADTPTALHGRLLAPDAPLGDTKTLVTFRAFAQLPGAVRAAYLAGALVLVPTPAMLVLFEHPRYRQLATALPRAMQIPLLHLFPRVEGSCAIRIPQSGWLDEHDAATESSSPRGHGHHVVPRLTRTHRWQRIARDAPIPAAGVHGDGAYTDKVSVALFATTPEAIDLYDKPLARNSQIWTESYQLLLDGPNATRAQLMHAAGVVDAGGRFGYRMYYPPMRAGIREVFWHVPVVARAGHGRMKLDGGGLPHAGSAAEGRRGSLDGGGLPHAGSAAEGRRGSLDGGGLPHAGSAAEGRRGSLDGGGLPHAGSAAEGRRGSLDGGGLPHAGSAAEGRRGSLDSGGLPHAGSAAEGRRGSLDGGGLPHAGSAAEGRRGSLDGGGLPHAGSAAEGRRGSLDGGGLPHAGSAAEGRRGSLDGGGLPHAGSAAEGRRGFLDAPLGYATAEAPDREPLVLAPTLLARPAHVAAARRFARDPGRARYTTSHNLRKLLEARSLLGAPLSRTHARALLHVGKDTTLEDWVRELVEHATDKRAALGELAPDLDAVFVPEPPADPGAPLVIDQFGTRAIEEQIWTTIAHLAHGEFRMKNDADGIAVNRGRHGGPAAKAAHVHASERRDLEALGDHLHARYRALIAAAGMTGRAECVDHVFRWETDFEFPWMEGWAKNQHAPAERNIVCIIPGKNRHEAVVMGDHYDTAYMEDVYYAETGGDQLRAPAAGADDNHSATTALLLAAEKLLPLAAAGKLERDVWLVHLTGEEYPADCMGARALGEGLVQRTLAFTAEDGTSRDVSHVDVVAAFVLDMIGHNTERDRDVFQIAPGEGAGSAHLARRAHLANLRWNRLAAQWNHADRAGLARAQRVPDAPGTLSPPPPPFAHLALRGEIRVEWEPRSALFNTDGQIFSDLGIPVVLFMENYDISRKGYHDTHDTMANIDLDYCTAVTAIAIETVADTACSRDLEPPYPSQGVDVGRD